MQLLIYHGKSIPSLKGLKYPFISLYQDNWNDFGWKCRFLAKLHRSEEEEIDLGAVRISTNGNEFRAQQIPALLKALPPKSASLGESIAYYRRISNLPHKLKTTYLSAMRDIVVKPERRARITDRNLWDKSFMREASSRHALKRGGFYVGASYDEVEPPVFEFEMTLRGAAGPHVVNFDFSCHGGLPNRTILLIGRNGTGKTQLLSSLATTVFPPQVFTDKSRKSVPTSKITPPPELSRVITISYNAFDEFPLPREPTRTPPSLGIAYRSRGSYKYCGLRGPDGTINADEIGRMLGEALEPVVESERTDVLQQVLSTLLDPARAEALTSEDEDTRDAALLALSAGQRLVVAIFSNIIGFIEEGSLLLIDEPETNLHPGLLTSVIAALNETLCEFDSYAIIASHSPILLQQIPSRSVRVFTRNNMDVAKVKELDFESFGEDLGELSRRVLGLADPERDFTHVLSELFEKHGSVQAVQELFPYPLGIPAQAHLYALEERFGDETDEL
ncbi:AAA family ATPase [Methylocystis sp. H4A]|uniref:AAA family ATPase n=1 Tax=Methylocystis sp. H4A TaxID=2785788 RepID=UPI0018C33E8A|nr:AAA family ATPase [Methylocystis sp. H4A]MBG0802816.1 AAA family ATPase [Methylocystis sp. H4A]